MANKKFYYHNKNKNKNQAKSADDASLLSEYSAEQLALTLGDLGICENTAELLVKGKISNAAELVVRSEKDLFRVQGFNKRMLFEVKDALSAKGMALKKVEQKTDAPAEKKSGEPREPKKTDRETSSDKEGKSSQKQKERDKQPDKKTENRVSNQAELRKSAKKSEDRSGSRFGLADRRQTEKPQKAQRTEQLKEPLPVHEWRKVMKGGKWGFSDGFKIVIPTIYDDLFAFKEDCAAVEIDGKCGFIDSENNIVIPLEYDAAMSFSEGLAMVVRGEKCGYINKQNELVIPFEYDAATAFENGEAKVKKAGKWATLTTDNKLTWI